MNVGGYVGYAFVFGTIYIHTHIYIQRKRDVISMYACIYYQVAE